MLLPSMGHRGHEDLVTKKNPGAVHETESFRSLQIARITHFLMQNTGI